MFNFTSRLLAEGDPIDPLPLIIGILAIGVLYYFMMIRPQRARRQKAAEMLNKITMGERVRTIGGVCGEIVAIDEDKNTIVIKTGTEQNFSYITFDKQAVYMTDTPKVAADAAINEATAAGTAAIAVETDAATDDTAGTLAIGGAAKTSDAAKTGGAAKTSDAAKAAKAGAAKTTRLATDSEDKKTIVDKGEVLKEVEKPKKWHI
jgi:preprotein translocase subunit YajC